MPSWENPLITIIGEKCRMCYACVRECPAKAIRVVEGQASVIQPRCIACGNCLRVCAQNAKEVRDDTERAFSLLETGAPVAAMLAPSFPAEFADLTPGRLVAMIRGLGFTWVHEVAFGADLVAHMYRKLVEEDPERRMIATACPAVVNYVCKYQPQLMAYLAPVVSPMVALARALRHDLGDDLRVVFIGPCVAKKGSHGESAQAGVDAVLTFAELREMFRRRDLEPESFTEDDRFDPPYGGFGNVFPISGGLLQAAGLQQDLLSGEMIVAEGRDEFIDTINEFDLAHADARLLDVLACHGCYAGPAMTNKETMLQRRTRVSNYAKNRLAGLAEEQFEAIRSAPEQYKDLNLYRAYVADYQPVAQSATSNDIEKILEHMGKHRTEDLLNCGACGYDTCIDHARAVYEGLADSDMCLPHTIEQLREAYDELEVSHRSLEEAQEALERSTKLASMGQLAAGIAHEVNNPLSTLLLHANLLLEECDRGSQTQDDLETIVDQANRCKRIISGLLNFARQSRVNREPTDIGKLVQKVLHTTAFAEDIEVRVRNEFKDPVADIDGDQIVQVLANLINNAQQAMPDGGRLSISLRDTPDEVTVRVSDTGEGVPEENMDRLFDPFFTTKQVGMGTGLGLAVTHGIVKMHKGQIAVESNADHNAGPTGTTFTLILPRHIEEGASGPFEAGAK
ncbi:MAG: ATP-binding protein [Actinobacteria bacterium]|nr:ATP-binding protein [Actinomycetota bacterium]